MRITSIFNIKGRIRAFLHRKDILRPCFEECDHKHEDLCTLEFEGINPWYCNKKLVEWDESEVEIY